jgi:hypothetical protein
VTAGVISIQTQVPTEQLEAMVEVNLGSDELRQVKSYVSGLLTDWLSGRLSVVDASRGQLIENVAGPDADGLNSYCCQCMINSTLSRF